MVWPGRLRLRTMLTGRLLQAIEEVAGVLSVRNQSGLPQRDRHVPSGRERTHGDSEGSRYREARAQVPCPRTRPGSGNLIRSGWWW